MEIYMKTVRIAAGAGYSGDRIEPAIEVAEKGNIQYLVFECLAERTIAIAQQSKLQNPEKGFDPLLEKRMQAVLPSCVKNGIKIITNMGAANPQSGANMIARIAQELGLSGLKIAAITGDDVHSHLHAHADDYTLMETGAPLRMLQDKMVSANAYMGAEPIVQALADGADIVITGRVSDPALFIAPLVHEFGWSMDDWDILGKATLAGHLLECAGQITGGYFADPGHKDVPDLARLGFPIGEVSADGALVITKVAGSGGAVTVDTVKEQLLYEVHNPAAYLTPDVVADFSAVVVQQSGEDRVQVRGATGTKRPDTLKVSVGYVDGYVGEGQISYAGPRALARAQLAQDIIKERLTLTHVQTTELRMDLIGVNAIHCGIIHPTPEPAEVRLRVAGRADSLSEAVRIGNEVETLYTNGPAGGGGATKSARQVVAVLSVLLPRHVVNPVVSYQEV
jgi:hypothetical protein